MDQLLADCGPGSDVSPGDEVVLIGRQGEAQITADEWVRLLEHDTISYEILCGVGPRVPRVYVGAEPGDEGRQGVLA
jgi:alanine racemase